MVLATLFILPEHRGKGLAGAAVRAMEGMAKIEPYGWKECKAMTLNTLARKYVEDEEWRRVGKWPYENMGAPLPERGMSNEDWYVRMGYVKWKEVPLYRTKDRDGEDFVFDATFMWKGLE
jgi:GNAT superfamily N-acetyltransferase